MNMIIHCTQTPFSMCSGKYHNGDSDLEPPTNVYYESDVMVKDWYCGGHIFYKWLENEGHSNFLINEINTVERNTIFLPKIDKALIDYFVSGAIRWLEEDPTLTTEICHTMLIHKDKERGGPKIALPRNGA